VVNFPCNVNVFECATSISLVPSPAQLFIFVRMWESLEKRLNFHKVSPSQHYI